MKQIEKNIAKTAMKVLDDVKFEYYKDRMVRTKISDYKSLYPEKYDGVQNRLIWEVWIEWYNPDFLGGKDAFMTIEIDDETGIADKIYITIGQGGPLDIALDSKGKYYVKNSL